MKRQAKGEMTLDGLAALMTGGFQAVDKKLSLKIGEVDRRLGAKIETLDSKIDGVEKNLSSKIDGVDKKLGAKIETLDSKIGEVDKRLSSKIGALDSKVSGIEKNLGTKIETLETKIEGLDTKIERLDTKVDERVDDLAAMTAKGFHTLEEHFDAQMIGLGSKLDSMNTELQSLRFDHTRTRARVEDLEIHSFGAIREA